MGIFRQKKNKILTTQTSESTHSFQTGWEAVYEGTTVGFVPKFSAHIGEQEDIHVSSAPSPKKTVNKKSGVVSQSSKASRALSTVGGRVSSSMLATSLILLLVSTPLILAFEAHVINVTATVINIDPPVILPPAAGQCQDSVNITISDPDQDATDIYYTITPGTDVNAAPDPVCGGPLGGGKPIGPLPALTQDSVVKAIACDAQTGTAHHSTVATVVYHASCFGKIDGHKYKDVNENEAFDPGTDFGVEGWRMNLVQNNAIVMTTLTDNTGYYTFNNLAPGTYVVKEEDRPDWIHVSPNFATTTIATNETHSVDFLNSESANQCIPQDIIFPVSLAVQAAGASSGNDDIAVDTNVTINGSVRSNDELERIGSNAITRTITGNAVVTHTVDAGFLISGGVIAGAATAALTNVDQATWKAHATIGGTVNGSFVFPDNLVGLSLGPTEIMGNVTFGANNTANIKGPLYIHGNLNIGTSTTLTEDSNLVDNFLTIIVDGTITIAPGASFVKSGTRGAFLLISNSAPVAGDGAAIYVLADNTNLGDSALYATNGDIHIGSQRSVLAAFAKGGTGADTDPNAAVRIDAGAAVAFRNLPTAISCGPRQPYETTSHVVINEFMPNPSAGKVGTSGGSLDGEWVELYNPTASPVDVSGYVLYDNDDTHALPITTSNSSSGSTLIPSKGRIVVYREGDTDFSMEVTGGDTVRLLSDLIGSGGTLIDSHTYTANAPSDKSFARIPDGTANWIDPESSPGTPNNLFFEPLPSMPNADEATLPKLPTINIPEGLPYDVPVSVDPDNDKAPKPLKAPKGAPIEIIVDDSAASTTDTTSSTSSGSDNSDSPATTENSTEDATTTPDTSTSTPQIETIPNSTASSTDPDGVPNVPSPVETPLDVIRTPLKAEDPQPTTDGTTTADTPPTPPDAGDAISTSGSQ